MSEESRFVRWWRQNPDKAGEIKRRRRVAYAEDPLIREHAKVAKAAYRRRKRARGGIPRRPKLFPFRGQMIEIWSVGVTADFLGVHKRTLCLLEQKKRIPINHLVDEAGHRWWPAEFIRWLRPLFDLRHTKSISAQEFSRRVSEEWKSEIQLGQIPVLEDHYERSASCLHQEFVEANSDSAAADSIAFDF